MFSKIAPTKSTATADQEGSTEENVTTLDERVLSQEDQPQNQHAK